MKMFVAIRKLGIVLAAAAGAGLLFLANPARADLTLVTHMTMKSPMMRNMPPSAQAQMNSLMQFTIYSSGKKVRVASPMFSMIIDPDNKKMDMINDTAKTYTEMPFDPTKAFGMLPGGAGGMNPMSGADYNVVDTGKTTMFLGHKVRHYVVTSHINTPNTGEMTIHSDILAAQDLPAADMQAFTNISSYQSGKTHVVGVPFKTVTTVTGGPMGTMTMTQTVTSLSTKPIPAYFFMVPSGYTQSQQPSGMPAPGMPGVGAPAPGSAPTQ